MSKPHLLLGVFIRPLDGDLHGVGYDECSALLDD